MSGWCAFSLLAVVGDESGWYEKGLKLVGLLLTFLMDRWLKSRRISRDGLGDIKKAPVRYFLFPFSRLVLCYWSRGRLGGWGEA